MKAILRITYPHFFADLVGFQNEVPTSVTPPACPPYNVLAVYQYEGGASLNLYSKFSQKVTLVEVKGNQSVDAQTGVLVIQGEVNGVKALGYISPSKVSHSLSGNAKVYFIR